MVWSPKSATNAYFDTVKLCKHEHESKHEPCTSVEPESSEFLSALAAGTSSQLIVEVSSEASHSTIALAAAARQTGGRLVCILPEGTESLATSKQVVDESGLHDMVEFKVGDPSKLLPQYENIDFSVIDCRTESYNDLLKLLDVNPKRSVVVANNLVGGKEGLSRDLSSLKEKNEVRSIMHPIGKGMEVTMIGRSDEFGMKNDRGHGKIKRKGEVLKRRPSTRSDWVRSIDEKGEEHIYRVTRSTTR